MSIFERYWAEIENSPDEGFGEAVRQYKWRLEHLQRSAKTLNDYSYRLHDFHRFLAETGVAFKSIDKGTIRSYLHQLRTRKSLDERKDKPLSDSTVYGFWKALSAWFNYLVQDGLWEKPNPILPMDTPQIRPKVQRPVLREDDIRVMLEVIDKRHPYGKRMELLLCLLWESAARVSEILNLRVRDCDLQNGFLNVIRKGGRPDYIPLTPAMRARIDRFIREKKLTPWDYLLGTRNARPMTIRMAERIVDTVWAKARAKYPHRWNGDFGKIHPHLIRASRLTFLAGKMDSLMLRKIAGHRSLQVIEKYVRFAEQDRERVKEAFLEATLGGDNRI